MRASSPTSCSGPPGSPRGGVIQAGDLDLGVERGDLGATAPVPASGTGTGTGTAAGAEPFDEPAGLDRDLKARERELILATLRATGGSRKLTAERLGISPRTLRHKLQQLKAAGVEVPRGHEAAYLAVSG